MRHSRSADHGDPKLTEMLAVALQDPVRNFTFCLHVLGSLVGLADDDVADISGDDLTLPAL